MTHLPTTVLFHTQSIVVDDSLASLGWASNDLLPHVVGLFP
jgi:hypothetical protein